MNTGAYDVLTEHQQIRRLVDRLESAIEKHSLGCQEWLDEARPALLELAAGLKTHFRGEETEFFGDVRERLPRHAPTVARLIEQHQRLAVDFAHCASDIATLNVSHQEGVGAFIDSLTKSLRLLKTHEEQENELMLVAYWQDLGESSE